MPRSGHPSSNGTRQPARPCLREAMSHCCTAAFRTRVGAVGARRALATSNGHAAPGEHPRDHEGVRQARARPTLQGEGLQLLWRRSTTRQRSLLAGANRRSIATCSTITKSCSNARANCSLRPVERLVVPNHPLNGSASWDCLRRQVIDGSTEILLGRPSWTGAQSVDVG